MSQNLQNFAKFIKIHLENLVDFDKCCKTHIYLQKSVPIQPKTSNILPKISQKPATTLRAEASKAIVAKGCALVPGFPISELYEETLVAAREICMN